MRIILRQFLVFAALSLTGMGEYSAGQAQTLEELEALGEGVEANAQKANEAKAKAQNANPSNKDVETAVPATSGNEQADFMRPAADMSGTQPIDIESKMKKITEPNLFSGAAPNPGTLRNLATGEAPEEYVVSEGDTLYDICDQLIDEPEYWPKLWAFNPTIENPHFVYPGMRLRFYAGDDKSPPFLQVITEDDILPVAKGKLVESELVREDISGMLMRSEIPENTTILDPKDLDSIVRVDNQFIMVGGNYRSDSKPVIIPAFIVAEEMDEIGIVVGGSAGSFLVDKGQQIIMKDEEGLEVGTTYSVVRRGDLIENSQGEKVGIRYEFVAQIKVTSEDQEKESVFKGDVIYNRLGVEPGDLVVPYRSVKRNVPNETVADGKGSQQEVVNFTEPNTELGGRGGFVFIDQTENKLQEKKTYRILQNVKVSASEFLKSSLPDTDSQIAHVYIIDASGAAALGYLVKDSLEVRLGDRVAD